MKEKLATKKAHKGFTLIELLVVMAIIAVLVTLIVAAINIARRASRDTARRNNTNAIKAALEEYFAQNKMYPGMQGVAAGTYVPISTIGRVGFLGNVATSASSDERTRFRTLLEDSVRDPNSTANPLEQITTAADGAFRYCYARGQVNSRGSFGTIIAGSDEGNVNDASKYGLYLVTEGTSRTNPTACPAGAGTGQVAGEDFSNR